MSHSPQGPIGIPGAGPGQPPALGGPTFSTPRPSVEPVNTAFVLAGWWRRFAALLTDAILRALLATVIGIAVIAAFSGDPLSTDTPGSTELSHLEAVGIIAAVAFYIVLPFLYAPAFMARWGGATPGKRLFGLRVVTGLGAAPSFGVAILREGVFKGVVVSWIGGTVFFVPWLLNYLWPVWDDQSRAGHDFMARTRVVRAAR